MITLFSKKEMFFFEVTGHPKVLNLVQTELNLHCSEHKCFIVRMTLYLNTKLTKIVHDIIIETYQLTKSSHYTHDVKEQDSTCPLT